MSRDQWTRLVFNAGSAAYDLLTNQAVWREQVASVLDHVPAPARVERVLDLGCGPGMSAFVLAERLPHASVDGVDLAEKMVSRARRHHARSFPRLANVRFHVGDATDLHWPDDTFDLAVGHSFLYLVPDRLAVLEQVRRVLRPGGTLVLLEPNRAGSLRAAAGREFGVGTEAHAPLDVARFRASMVLWRVVSGSVGRLDPMLVQDWLLDAGFDTAEVVPTLGGLGMHCVARRAETT